MVRKKKTLQVLDSLEMELAVVCSIGGRNIEGQRTCLGHLLGWITVLMKSQRSVSLR